MTRYRWYRLSVPCDFEEFLRRLRSLRSGRESEAWFEIQEDSSRSANFTFWIKSEITVTRIGLDGASYREAIVTATFLNAELLARGKRIFLRLTNAWRSVAPLMRALEDAAGFGFSVKVVTLKDSEVTRVLDEFEEANLVGLRAINVIAGPDLVGRMEFASRQGIDRNKIKVLRGVPHQIEHSSYNVLYRGVRGFVSFSASGAVKIGGALAPRILSVLEKELISSQLA